MRRWGAVACATLTLACSGGGPESGTGALESASQPAALSAVRTAPAADFFRVVAVRVLSDQRVVVADGSQTMRWFSPDGGLVARAGGKGSGPGEFQFLGRLDVLHGDTVAAVDPAQRRVTVFASDAMLVRVVTTEIPGVLGSAVPIGRTTSGRLLFRGFTGFRGRSGRWRDTSTFQLMDEDGSRPVRSGRYAGMEYFADDSEPGPVPNFQLAFSGVSSPAVTGDTVWVLVEGGPRLDGWLEGERILVDSVPGSVRYLSDADVRDWMSAAESRVPSERRVAWRETRDRLPFIREMPPFDSLLAGRDGTLWARRQRFEGTGGEIWLRVRGNSTLPGELFLPDRFRALDVGSDYVAGVRLDELDRERVEVLSFD